MGPLHAALVSARHKISTSACFAIVARYQASWKLLAGLIPFMFWKYTLVKSGCLVCIWSPQLVVSLVPEETYDVVGIWYSKLSVILVWCKGV
jgi:hypothetical protein